MLYEATMLCIPKGIFYRNILEDKVFTVSINMWIFPIFIEITHCFGGIHDTGFNIKMISKIAWYVEAQVFEVLDEIYESIH